VLESKFSDLSTTADTSNKLKNKLTPSSRFTSPSHQTKTDNNIPSTIKTFKGNPINNSSYNNSDKKSKFNLELSDKKNNIYTISKNEAGGNHLTKLGETLGNMVVATGKIKRPTMDKPKMSSEFHTNKFENDKVTNSPKNSFFKQERNSMSPDRMND